MTRSRQASAPTSDGGVLGIDIGGVLIPMAEGPEDTSFFGGRPMDTPAQPGMFSAVSALSGRFSGRVHLVSKCGPKIERVTRDWLNHVDFWDRTDIAPAHLHIVRERPAKAAVCDRLGITHFIDDRLDVLAAMNKVQHRYLFLAGRDGRRGVPLPRWARPLDDWNHAVQIVSPY